MEAVSLNVIDGSSVKKGFYLEMIQNPYERFSREIWLCNTESGRKVFLTSMGVKLNTGLLQELVEKKLPLVS